MRYLFIAFFLHLFLIAQSTQGYGAVAEASTNSEHHYSTQYDLSGLSAQERKWFLTFIKGNILAQGWGQITADLLRHVAREERERQRQLLNQLGTKIGREWCKDNDVRRIDTSKLSDWGGMLKKAAKKEPRRLAEVIRHIDGEVNSLLD